jgi:hypothetical protein
MVTGCLKVLKVLKVLKNIQTRKFCNFINFSEPGLFVFLEKFKQRKGNIIFNEGFRVYTKRLSGKTTK